MSLSLCLLRATIIQPPWPSGRGQEIGSLHGYLWEVCNSLSRPFFYDDKVASTFILDRALGLAVIGVELSYLPEGLSDKAIIAHFEEHRLFFLKNIVYSSPYMSMLARTPGLTVTILNRAATNSYN